MQVASTQMPEMFPRGKYPNFFQENLEHGSEVLSEDASGRFWRKKTERKNETQNELKKENFLSSVCGRKGTGRKNKLYLKICGREKAE
jgi:hypothetical protein